MSKSIPCMFLSEVSREVHAHEIVLSFIADKYAGLFSEWLEEIGFEQFNQYCEEVKGNG